MFELGQCFCQLKIYKVFSLAARNAKLLWSSQSSHSCGTGLKFSYTKPKLISLSKCILLSQ